MMLCLIGMLSLAGVFFFFFFFFSLLLIARPQAFLDAVDKP